MKMRAVFGALAVVALTLGSSSLANAIVTGGCKASATGTISGTVDITTATQWRVKNADVVNGTGTAPTKQRKVQVNVLTLGIGVPIINTEGEPESSGSAGPYAVADYSRLARVIAVSGASDTCSGSFKVIVDDVGPMQTALGIGGTAAVVLGLLGVAAVATRSGGAGPRLGGALAGVLAGLGLGLVLQEAEVLDPMNIVGAALPLLGIAIGAVAPGTLRRRR